MTRLGLILLAVVTVIAVALVGVSIKRQPIAHSVDVAGELVFQARALRV